MIIIPAELTDEIGKYLGFQMWNTRDKTKEYDFPNAREEDCLPGDAYVESCIQSMGNIHMDLLHYRYCGHYHGAKSLYVLNLRTLKPTKGSPVQKLLSLELIKKIKVHTKTDEGLHFG
jgi:hypothetical protein